MKDFQILRYLKQFKFLIAIGSILAGLLFYYVANNRLQSYTASTVIEYLWFLYYLESDPEPWHRPIDR